MPFGWKDEEITLSVELKDLIKMAKLPGKKDEWYVSESEAVNSEKLDMADEPDARAYKITFRRCCIHKL